MMGEKNRLGMLEVGESRHHDIRVSLGQIQKRALEPAQSAGYFSGGLAQIKSNIQSHLIVPASAGVKTRSHIADFRDQRVFDVHMYIFEFGGEFEIARFNLFLDLAEPFRDFRRVGVGYYTRSREHRGMSQTPLYIIFVETFVEGYRFGEFTHRLLGSLFESAAP
jgi:hypothetical protein